MIILVSTHQCAMIIRQYILYLTPNMKRRGQIKYAQTVLTMNGNFKNGTDYSLNEYKGFWRDYGYLGHRPIIIQDKRGKKLVYSCLYLVPKFYGDVFKRVQMPSWTEHFLMVKYIQIGRSTIHVTYHKNVIVSLLIKFRYLDRQIKCKPYTMINL